MNTSVFSRNSYTFPFEFLYNLFFFLCIRLQEKITSLENTVNHILSYQLHHTECKTSRYSQFSHLYFDPAWNTLLNSVCQAGRFPPAKSLMEIRFFHKARKC